MIYLLKSFARSYHEVNFIVTLFTKMIKYMNNSAKEFKACQVREVQMGWRNCLAYLERFDNGGSFQQESHQKVIACDDDSNCFDNFFNT